MIAKSKQIDASRQTADALPLTCGVWSQVKFACKLAVIDQKAVSGQGHDDRAAYEDQLGRYVPLEPELLAALIMHRKKLVGPKNVFCHSDGRHFTRFECHWIAPQ